MPRPSISAAASSNDDLGVDRHPRAQRAGLETQEVPDALAGRAARGAGIVADDVRAVAERGSRSRARAPFGSTVTFCSWPRTRSSSMRVARSSITVRWTAGSLAAVAAARRHRRGVSRGARPARRAPARAARRSLGGAGAGRRRAPARQPAVATAGRGSGQHGPFHGADSRPPRAARGRPFQHNGLHGGPDPAARRRLELPLSRLPRAARPARPGRRSDRRDPRRRLDDEAAARAVSGGARRLRLRRQGQDLSRRLVPRVQGDAHGDARRPRAADRADPRGRQAARLAGADGAGHRGRRRHRHDLVHGRQGRLQGRHLDRRQGPGAARRRERRRSSTR